MLDGAFTKFEAQAAGQWREWGARNFRFVQRTKNHPTLPPSPRPGRALFVEWVRRPPTLTVQSQSFGNAIGTEGAMSGFSGYRVYPWPDHKDLP